MPKELTGHRRQDMAFSHFYRRELPDDADVADVDGVIWCQHGPRCRRPLALLETAMDYGQADKPSKMLHELARARDYDLPAYVVLFTRNPDVPASHPEAITRFRIRPAKYPGRFDTYSPAEAAEFLRQAHHPVWTRGCMNCGHNGDWCVDR